jgi:hypothetical protein
MKSCAASACLALLTLVACRSSDGSGTRSAADASDTAIATGGATPATGGVGGQTGGMATGGRGTGGTSTSETGTGGMGTGGKSSGGTGTGGTGTGGKGIGGKSTGGTDAGGTGTGGTGTGGGSFMTAPKPRILVLTDISNEPDDEESLVRFLVYSNEYDVAGLVATTSTHLKTGTREDLIRAQLDAFEQVRANLLAHATGFPTAAELRAVTATGQTAYGMQAVGSGKDTAGSKLIIDAVDKADTRPIWIAGWCGMNTLAQALTDVRASRTKAEVDSFVAKLRVYAISDQDDAGLWLRSQFPELFYVVSPSDQTADDYYLATWTGISGDEHYANGPGYRMDLVANAWLTTNISTGHGPLGKLYPQWKYIMEGDTPSFLGLVDNGLGSTISPRYGGWGGRYALSKPAGEPREIWTNASDTFEYKAGTTNTSNQATLWRWRPDYQYDFAARMDWCNADSFAKANHNPVPALNGDASKRVMTISAQAGATLKLSAEGTSDPDGNTVTVRWRIYPEAGTLGSIGSWHVNVERPLRQLQSNPAFCCSRRPGSNRRSCRDLTDNGQLVPFCFTVQ